MSFTLLICLINSVFMFLEHCSDHFLISSPVRAFTRVGEFMFALQWWYINLYGKKSAFSSLTYTDILLAPEWITNIPLTITIFNVEQLSTS